MKNYGIKKGDNINVLFANWIGRGWASSHGPYVVYEKNGRLGIDYNTQRSPYTCNGDIFVPLEGFSGSTVGFEKTETGDIYHYSNIKEAVVDGYPDLYKS